jgi:predicted RNase H-like nuclease
VPSTQPVGKIMKFIGIDLGWTSGASGLCCLSWQDNHLKILDLTIHLETDKIFAWLDRWVSSNEPALVAVDAPTLIPNATGMRLADKLTHKYFRQYHAGCYPANLSRPFAKRTVEFGLSLEERGFLHAVAIEPQKLGRYQIEVFPHPATVNLFKLDRILKYKKGRLAHRKAELIKLRTYIETVLPKLEPCLYFEKEQEAIALRAGYAIANKTATNIIPTAPYLNLPIIDELIIGSRLKEIEDQLDSLICAYVGAHWWYWGIEKNLVLGDFSTGYIIVPTPFINPLDYFRSHQNDLL